MWVYVKHLEHPVRVTAPDPGFAKLLLTQFGGPDGEFSASWRYLSQRYTMPTGSTKALMVDIGTEELAHLEMVGTMFHMLVRDATPAQLRAAGIADYYAIHGFANYLADSTGNPWIAAFYQSTGDPVADLHEDMAAEQKARAAYERLICLTKDPGIIDALRFLREREVVHFQRFGEGLVSIQQYLNDKHRAWPGVDLPGSRSET